MNEQIKETYGVDIVFCIDCTSSMKNRLDAVKTNALNFYGDVINAMQAKNKHIDEMRIRVIAFRDYLADGNDAMLDTPFLKVPDDDTLLRHSLESMVATGGGGDLKDGLEALAYAIRSDWSTSCKKRRHIIVLWTDASTHPLGYGKTAPEYPAGMAKDIDELTAWWGDAQNEGYINNQAKQLVLFAPDSDPWNFITRNWENVVHFPSKAGNGLQEVDYNHILDTIVAI